MQMLQTIGHIIFLIVFIYMGLGILYLLALAIGGVIRRKKVYKPVEHKNRIAVLIPAYKEDVVILDTALKASRHNYPKDKFEVYVIADKLQDATIQKLESIPVNVVRVKFESSTKAKSLQAALHRIEALNFDHVLILDADNVMELGCMEQVNAALVNGAAAVQCHRTAKNKHTAVAVLDAISEEINNHLFRKGPQAFNVSANLIGSGMAFRYTGIREILDLPHILTNPGEDREIDLQLMKRGINTEYLDDAIVYDEKVASAQVFEKQRVRWLEAQVMHFKRFMDADIRSARLNSDYINKFVQTLLLPRSLYILALGLMMSLALIDYIFKLNILYPAPIWWVVMAAVFALMLLISIPASLYNGRTLRAVMHIPVLILSMVKALLKIKKNRTEFLHTEKKYTSG